MVSEIVLPDTPLHLIDLSYKPPLSVAGVPRHAVLVCVLTEPLRQIGFACAVLLLPFRF